MAKLDNKRKVNSNLGKRVSIDLVVNDIYREKKLAEFARDRDSRAKVNREMLSKGMAWYDSGLLLEDASEDYRNEMSFVQGYNIAKRREYAKNLKQENPKKR